jgi:hypothetical protein
MDLVIGKVIIFNNPYYLKEEKLAGFLKIIY